MQLMFHWKCWHSASDLPLQGRRRAARPGEERRYLGLCARPPAHAPHLYGAAHGLRAGHRLHHGRPAQLTRTIEKELEIDAPIEAVWKALTDAEELTNWFPLEARVKPGVGGSIWRLESWEFEVGSRRRAPPEPISPRAEAIRNLAPGRARRGGSLQSRWIYM